MVRDSSGFRPAVHIVILAAYALAIISLMLRDKKVLGFAAQDALMVGDTRYDEEAAAAAGTSFLHYDLREDGSLSRALRARLRPR